MFSPVWVPGQKGLGHPKNSAKSRPDSLLHLSNGPNGGEAPAEAMAVAGEGSSFPSLMVVGDTLKKQTSQISQDVHNFI